ncbi:SEC-C metal-binding domain-containing protein [Actinoplanes oblitus]
MIGQGKELIEKLGGKDPCPCGSGRRFPQVLPRRRQIRRHQRPLLRP